MLGTRQCCDEFARIEVLNAFVGCAANGADSVSSLAHFRLIVIFVLSAQNRTRWGLEPHRLTSAVHT